MSEDDRTRIILLETQLKTIKNDVNRLRYKFDSNVVTRSELTSELSPIKKVVYGALTALIGSAVTGLIALLSKGI